MLKARILTSLVLIPSFLVALFYSSTSVWTVLVLAMCLLATWEWTKMLSFSKPASILYVVSTLALGLFMLVDKHMVLTQFRYQLLFWGILAAAIFWILITPFWLISRVKIKQFSLLALAGWLIIFPLFLSMVALRNVSPLLLLQIMLAVWIADSAAYFAGKAFGKHKLAPLISPGKTWEGVLGAWLAVSVYGALLCWQLHYDIWIIVGLWGITVLSIMGDLLESLIKRQSGVKDSGNILPGHGGVLDRIDGLTSSLPLAAFFIYFPIYYAAWYG
jgi:phosphatidate cytidylyltransferase